MQQATAAVMLRLLQRVQHGMAAALAVGLGELEEGEDLLALAEPAMHAPLITCTVRVHPGILHSLCGPNTSCQGSNPS